MGEDGTNEGNFMLENPAGNYMFKGKKRNTRARCEICAKLTSLLTLNIFHTLL